MDYIEKNIFPLSIMFENKILTRSNINGLIEFDLMALKENSLEMYEDFLNKSEEFMDSLKTNLIHHCKRIVIKNFDGYQNISSIRKSSINKIIAVSGMISQITKVIAMVKSSTWECSECPNIITTKGDTRPKGCLCSNRGKFSLLRQEFIDIQEIELEEVQDNIGDRQPQKIRIRLLDDLCSDDFSGVYQPGNKIEVIGIVKKVQIYNKKKDEELFEYRIMAYQINPLDDKFLDDNISEEDIKRIEEIAADNPIEKLSKNIASSIHGHDEIKKALLLMMVGGVKTRKPDGTSSRDRIHVLLCGDPGVAKSKLAKNIQLRMPKSYYTSGDSSTRAGLISTVDKDPLLGQWVLKTGALSKANDSILIIDELDKTDEEDRKGLHTPMESGYVQIDKATIHATITANCSILGIANPKDGIFDDNPSNPISKQINLLPSLLTRFDLIFIMKDKIDEKTDDAIIDLVCGESFDEDEISIELFRKYIIYAKKIKPKGLNKDLIKNKLKDFYKKIRRKSDDKDSGIKGIPITPRNAEGITRLAQASAKINLRDEIEESDIEFAIQLFVNSLLKLGMDTERGVVDMARVGFGKTINKKEKCRMILETMRELREEIGEYIKDELIKEKCFIKGINKYEADELIHELNKEGYLILTSLGWKIT